MTVYDILQDQKGFIWLGTDAGICRYDGYKFQLFEVPNSKGNSFSDLKQDQSGRIYFMNFANQIFYIEQGEVKELRLPKKCKKTGFSNYSLDSRGNIYLLAYQIYHYDIRQKKWSLEFEADKNIESGKIILDENDQVWALTNLGLIRKIGQHYQAESNPKERWHQIFQANQKIYHINYETNLIQYFQESSQRWQNVFSEVKKFKRGSIIKAFADRAQNVWILTRAGVMCFDKNDKPLYNGLVFLKDKFVSSFIQDREGNYWFSTIGEGVFVMYNKDFLTYNAENSILPFTQINCLAKNAQQQVIVAGNANQVLEFNPEKNTFQTYNLIEADVESIFLDEQKGQIFIENGRIQVFNINDRSKIFSFHAGSTPKDIAELSDNILLIASGNGAFIAEKTGKNIQTKAFDQFASPAYWDYGKSVLLIRRKRSRSAWVDKEQKRFWVGYADGLYYYEKGKEKELKSPDNQDIIALDMVQDQNNILWVATARKGVFGIKGSKIVAHFNTENGLISNFCKVIKTEKGRLWIGTNKGLQLFYLNKNKTSIFTKENGLASNEIKDLLLQKDKVWVASSKGLTVFAKNYEKKKYTAPLIYISDFAVWEKSQQLQESYTLNYEENNLKIEFVGLSFESNKDFSYQYRLLGLSDKWITVKSHVNFARYPSLPAGKYEFQVKTINKDAIESEKTATISIIILKPFWQKWWFILLMSLGLLAIISLVFWFRIRAVQRKNKLEKDVLEANLAALKVQMNPHFIFNSLSSIQNYVLKGKRDDADRYLSKFAKLTRRVLENSRQDYISIEEEAETLRNYLELEQLYAEKNFNYTIEIDGKINRSTMKIPPLFAQPFVENAIKHGIRPLEKTGEIRVAFTLLDNLILLEIQDNGVGRKNAKNTKNHQSLSTQITEERLHIFQETINKAVRMEITDILDNENQISGTSVKLFLPLQL